MRFAAEQEGARPKWLGWKVQGFKFPAAGSFLILMQPRRRARPVTVPALGGLTGKN